VVSIHLTKSTRTALVRRNWIDTMLIHSATLTPLLPLHCPPPSPPPPQRTASCVLFKSPLSTAAATVAPSTARARASSEPPSKYPSETSLQGRSGHFARAPTPVVGTSADGRSLSLRANTRLNSTPTPNQHTAIPPHNMPYCLKVSSALQVDTAYMPAPPPLRLRPSPRRL
jgi:hypothetical protein